MRKPIKTRPTVEEILSKATLSGDARGERPISSAKPGCREQISAVTIIEAQSGVHTWQVDLGPEVSEAFNDVASLKGPEQPSLEESKLHSVCYTFSRKRLAWPDKVYQSS